MFASLERADLNLFGSNTILLISCNIIKTIKIKELMSCMELFRLSSLKYDTSFAECMSDLVFNESDEIISRQKSNLKAIFQIHTSKLFLILAMAQIKARCHTCVYRSYSLVKIMPKVKSLWGSL